MFRRALLLLIFLLGSQQSVQAACEGDFLENTELKGIYQTYFNKLKSQSWEETKAFSRLEGNNIYMTPAFDLLKARQKKSILALLLLDYGEYASLRPLLSPTLRKSISGTMLPYHVYAADGRILSIPYNPCNRLVTLTEYERSRLSFLGVKISRKKKYPMSEWQIENVKKAFWKSVGYSKAGKYWIAWVPEKGYFEINVPSLNHQKLLEKFWQQAPNYYKYAVLDRGSYLYTYFRGEQTRAKP